MEQPEQWPRRRPGPAPVAPPPRSPYCCQTCSADSSRGGRGLIWPAHIQRQPQPGQSQREDQVSPAVLDQDSRAGPLHRHRFNAAVHLVWQSLPDRRLRTPGRIGQAVSGNRHDHIARTQDRGGLAGRQVNDDAVGLPDRSSRPNDARIGGCVQVYGSGNQRENSEPRGHNCCRAALRMCHGRVRRATRTSSSRSVAGGSTRADLQPVRRRVRQIAAPESDSGHKRPAFRRNRCRLRPHSRDSPTLNPGEQRRSAQAGRRRMISLTGRRGVAGSGLGCGKPNRSTSCGDNVPPRTSSRSSRRVDPTSSG